MGLLGGKSEEEQLEAILANQRIQRAKQSEEKVSVNTTSWQGDPFSWHGVIRSLHDFAYLDGEDKGY